MLSVVVAAAQHIAEVWTEPQRAVAPVVLRSKS
jgi:hypothetical protein